MFQFDLTSLQDQLVMKNTTATIEEKVAAPCFETKIGAPEGTQNMTLNCKPQALA